MSDKPSVLYKKILAGVGSILLIPGIMALLSVIISLYFNESAGTHGFLITATACFIVGGVILFLCKKELKNYRDFELLEVMSIASLGWTMVALAAAIPFYYMSNAAAPLAQGDGLYDFSTFLNCFFEGTSGITSTGLSMSDTPHELPRSLQWWRSFVQWIGGAGLIVFISMLLGPESTTIEKYYGDDEKTKALPTISLNLGDVGLIYLIFTILAVLALYFQGISFWESLNHGLTAIATGGFSITSDSLRSYPANLKWTVMIITIAGALNFGLYDRAVNKKSLRPLYKDTQVLSFVGLLIAGIFFLHADNQYENLNVAFVDSAFQLTSALGTAGFQTSDVDYWSPMALLLIAVCMMIGGNTGSTTSGIKTFRLMGLVKGSYFYAVSLFYEKGEKLHFNINNKGYSEKESLNIFRHITVFVSVFLFSFSVFAVVLYYMVPDYYTFSQILFEASSAFNNVGQSTGITGPELNDGSKITMIIGMLIGRIELIPLYVLAFISFKGWKG